MCALLSPVVLNLAVAVKELVENSLDAGATIIDVRLREYGSELIEVTDNGSGVEPNNFQGLTLKHHTSKLQDFSDLVSVETFGFRGEALSSLCSLSDLIVTTRHVSSDCGSRLVFDHNGIITTCAPVARQVGTTVTLENIFSTLPVRQKEFHRNLKREFVKMTQLLYAYCLVSTGVKITCTNQTKKGGRMTVAATQGCNSVRDNIACVFGIKQLASLLEMKTVLPTSEMLEQLSLKDVDLSQSVFEMEGFISSCAHGQGRSTNDRQFYYVNSRPCEPTKVTKAVNEVFHQYNMHQQPFVFLNIQSARDSVDVNVTPDKRQVFLEHEKLLIATVKASLQSLYENIPSTYNVNNLPSPTSKPNVLPSPTCKTSPAAMLSQWRHNTAAKRPASEQASPKLPKQVKLDSVFTKKEKSAGLLSGFSTISNSTLNEDSDPKVTLEHNQVQSINHEFSDHVEQISPTKHFNIVEHSVSEKGNTNSTENSVSMKNSSRNEPENDIGMVSCKYNSKSPLVTNEVERDSQSSRHSSSSELSILTSQSSEYEKSNHLTPVNIPYPTQSSVSNSSEISLKEDPRSDITHASPISKLVSETKIATDSSNQFLSSNKPRLFCEDPDVKSVSSRAELDVTVSAQNNVDSEDFNHNRSSVEVSLTMEDLRKRVKQLCDEEDGKEDSTVKFRAVIDPSRNKQAEEELSREISKDMFLKMEVVGQFNLGFIIAKLHSDLFIIDQHATDEKYNFETLQRTTTISNQKLVVPQQLELTAVNESILIDSIDVFKANGFEFKIDENAPTTKKVKLTSIPMSKNWTFGKDDIDELLFMLQDSPNTLCRPSRVRAMFASRACRKSVMIGTALSHSEMKRLIVHMGEIEQPWNCPHGRPTMRHLINLAFL
ncbi:hypothetical protein J6590_002307 [Homalodisca vitripennis]|nr:hypothetical protein J6590_002307 [Homalodisca vitripennis]